ncbi:helix-turn-helix transcriptional regulator, partial [bacterium]|nr:helix-turn-helix transcriptional regulator [bacterium]
IAKDLAVSVRKLQQKLSEEKTSFSEILKTTRLNLSKDYLKQNEHSMSEIAFLLGFSEPGVFSKAFIKWTGFTPLQYRKNVS